MKKPLLFQASSSSQKRDVTLLLLCPASCCRESVAGSVNSSSSSQSVSKAPELRQREGTSLRVRVCGSTIALLCCINAVSTQHLCQGCSIRSRVKVITQLPTQGLIPWGLSTKFAGTQWIHSAVRARLSTGQFSVKMFNPPIHFQANLTSLQVFALENCR